MGLDITIDKYDREGYHKAMGIEELLPRHENLRRIRSELFYYRKREIIKSILGHVTGGTYSQCDHFELEKTKITRAISLSKWLMGRSKNQPTNHVLTCFINDLSFILEHIDFKKDIVIFSWVS